jgi:hypothetical protein
MTTLDLYNMALGMIGHDRTIAALPSTETEAVRCNTFYAPARRALFALYDWKWLSVQASITATAPAVNGLYIQDAIAGMLRLLNITDANGIPLVHEVVAGRIHTDAATVLARYITDNTAPDTWPPLIVDAVAAELAARICVPMTGNAQRSADLHAQALSNLQAAASQSGDQAAPGNQPATRSGSWGAGYRAAMADQQGR